MVIVTALKKFILFIYQTTKKMHVKSYINLKTHFQRKKIIKKQNNLSTFYSLKLKKIIKITINTILILLSNNLCK